MNVDLDSVGVYNGSDASIPLREFISQRNCGELRDDNGYITHVIHHGHVIIQECIYPSQADKLRQLIGMQRHMGDFIVVLHKI